MYLKHYFDARRQHDLAVGDALMAMARRWGRFIRPRKSD